MTERGGIEVPRGDIDRQNMTIAIEMAGKRMISRSHHRSDVLNVSRQLHILACIGITCVHIRSKLLPLAQSTNAIGIVHCTTAWDGNWSRARGKIARSGIGHSAVYPVRVIILQICTAREHVTAFSNIPGIATRDGSEG